MITTSSMGRLRRGAPGAGAAVFVFLALVYLVALGAASTSGGPRLATGVVAAGVLLHTIRMARSRR
jgi:hypothetical protein